MDHDFDRVRDLVLSLADLDAAEREKKIAELWRTERDLAAMVEDLLKFDIGGPPELDESLQADSVGPGAGKSGKSARIETERDALSSPALSLLARLVELAAAPSIDALVTSAPAHSAERKPQLESGDRVAGRYRVEVFLARGGMGEVHRATDELLGVPVALKVIRREVASDPAALRRFKQEVLLARSISHPNVCRIFDLGWDSDREFAFLTMEFLPGPTLREKIRNEGAPSKPEALRIVAQLAEGLDAAHRVGVVHRDFKSANVILVEPDGRVVITDFGLALDLDAAAPKDEGWTIVGTPAYMSPEQVTGTDLGPASDLYSLGVVLFELFTGRLPYLHKTPLEVAWAHVHDGPPPPSSLANIEPAWEATVLQLLSKEPGDRPRSAAAVVARMKGLSPQPEDSRHSLPGERDAFVGREKELAKLAEVLEVRQGPSRLVTLLGPGGIGKTRLAVRYGWTSLDRWPGGIWFCDLTEAQDEIGVSHGVAAGLKVPLGKGEPLKQIGHAIAGRGSVLIVLDNFEQVAATAAETVGLWCDQAPQARFLVTSRQRLQLAGESVLEPPPLDPGSRGVELLELRAREHRLGFEIGTAERETAEQIVEHLDGLPLAIEFAASRLRALELAQLRERLQDRLPLLAGPGRGRRSTMTSTLDWSWDLLEPWEQAAVAQSSVFEGGFTLQAAEHVWDLPPDEESPSVLDVVQSLVDKSWLQTNAIGGAARFQMYVTVREYAKTKLEASNRPLPTGSESDGSTFVSGLKNRHLEFYAGMGRPKIIDSLSGREGRFRWPSFFAEYDNLRCACEHFLSEAESGTGRMEVPDLVEAAAQAFAAVAAILQMRGPLISAARLGRRLLNYIEVPEHRARVLHSIAFSEHYSGVMDPARAAYEQARALYEEVGDRRGFGIVLNRLSTLHREQGRIDESLATHEQAMAIHRETGDDKSAGIALGNVGVLHLEFGRLKEARENIEEALAIHRRVGNPSMEANVLGNLGVLMHHLGRFDEARSHLESARQIHSELGNPRGEAGMIAHLGVFLLEQGRMEDAFKSLDRSLKLHREVGDRRGEGVVLSNLARHADANGNPEDSRIYLEAALSIHRELGARRSEAVALTNLGILEYGLNRTEKAQECYEAALVILRELDIPRSLGFVLSTMATLHADHGRYEEAARCFEEGLAALEESDRVEWARTMCARGKLEVRMGDLSTAKGTLAAAEGVVQSLDPTAESPLGKTVEELRTAIAEAE